MRFIRLKTAGSQGIDVYGYFTSLGLSPPVRPLLGVALAVETAVLFVHFNQLASLAEIREVCAPDLARAVAQLGRAPASGAGGRGFKSHQPDFAQDQFGTSSD